MTETSTMKRRTDRIIRLLSSGALIACFAALLGACTQNEPVRTSGAPSKTVSAQLAERQHGDRSQEGAATAEVEEPRPRPGRAIAYINDAPISQAEFLRLLLDSRGLPVLQQVLVREAARQEAARRSISVTQADIDHEFDLALRGDRFNGKDVESLTPSRRDQLIEDWTRTRGVSRTELYIAMERQAILRKILQAEMERATIDDEMLQREYRRTYGEKVVIRHIQFSNQRVVSQIRQRLDLGERFEDLVSDYSQNALTKIRQGLMPPFAAEDETVPPILAKAAFEMQPGDVSNPIEVDGYFHIIRLERRIPPVETPIEDVSDVLRQSIRARLIEQEIEELGRRLIMGANLRIEDPAMREQYQRQQRTGRIEGPPLVGQ